MDWRALILVNSQLHIFSFSLLSRTSKIVQVHFHNLVFFHSLVKLKMQLNAEGKIPVRK